MKGTTANTVAVGFTETDMVSKMPPAMREAVNQNVLAKQSLGPRAALPEDIADVVGFLCGPDSRWVTGSVVSDDAGMVKIMTNGSKNAVLHAEYCTRKKTDLAED